MWNVQKVIVLFAVIYISQEVEVTTSEPSNASVEVTTPMQREEFTSNQIKARPPFHPKPVGVNQIIPPGSALPDSSNSTTEDYVKPQTVLEYNPLKPFHQPFPINQIIPPGTPWPASAEEHETVKPTKSPPAQTFPIDLVERFPELTTLNKRTTTPKVINTEQEITTNVKPATVLEYKPIISPHLPHPVTLAQIVPPGEPWPASAEGYETTKASSSETTIRPELISTKTTTTKVPQSKKTKVPLLVSRKTTTTKMSTNKETTKTTAADSVESITVLEYKPTTTFHLPNPVTVAQLIPPGKPWPASPDEYQTTQGSSSATTASPSLDETTEYVESQTVLEYKPITSSFLPRPVTTPQLVPPGKPWPASSEATQTKPPITQSSSLTPNLTDRFPELVSISTTSKKPRPTVPSAVSSTTTSSTRLILTYKPSRPWYYPKPSTIGQLIPPGKPWPASPSGYPSFSITTLPPWLKDSVDEEAGNNELPLPPYKTDELQSLKEERSLEPNALQYYGPSITAKPTFSIAEIPFTSGTQKTTIADIVDILKEVHNITLVSGNAAPSPSHLLPFDVDKGAHAQVGSSVVRRPPSKGHQQQVPPPVKVYDGAVSFEGPARRDRIFTNPKFAQQ